MGPSARRFFPCSAPGPFVARSPYTTAGCAGPDFPTWALFPTEGGASRGFGTEFNSFLSDASTWYRMQFVSCEKTFFSQLCECSGLGGGRV